jgi:hypothetical protein
MQRHGMNMECMLERRQRVAMSKRAGEISFLILLALVLTACNRGATVNPDFDKAVQAHLDSISNRDIDAFKANLTRDETLYTMVQNGHAFTKPSELIEIHEQWFKDPDWIWEGEVVHKVVGEDVAMALVKYQYRAKPDDEPFSTWLLYVFQLQDGGWRIVHDQNAALDFFAFARSAGIEIK